MTDIEIKTIRTDGFDDLVVLKKRDFDALRRERDDAADLAAAYRAQLDDRRDDIAGLPIEAFKRVLAGASPVKVWRETAGLSIDELAMRSSVPSAEIAAIEAGGEIIQSVRLALAKALRADPAEL
jgi:hypothetical protein